MQPPPHHWAPYDSFFSFSFLLFFRPFGCFCFALFLRLALADHLRLGRRSLDDFRRRLLLLFHPQRHHVRYDACRLRQHFDFLAHRQVGHTQVVADGQLRYIHGDVVRDVVREALDLYLAQDELEDPTLHLHAFGLAGDVNGDFELQPGVAGHAHHVHVQQVAVGRIHLPVPQHHTGGRFTPNVQREDGVVAGLGVQDLGDFPGVDHDGDRRPAAPVHHGRDASRMSQASRGVLAEILPRLRLHIKNLSHTLLLLATLGPAGRGRRPLLRFR